ncbi:MAG: NUDIX domain-containing protein [Pseudomonadota bacterium]|nr:NUDIX domain-containing protein [Pseudomonadota bacterium]
MTDQPYHITQRTPIYRGFSSLDQLTLDVKKYNGGWMRGFQRELVDRPAAAGVFLFDPIRELCVFVEQFRVGAINQVDSPWLLEVVAGVFDKAGEDAADVVVREAIEEANCNIIATLPMCSYLASPGYTNEKIHLLLGFVNADDVDQNGVHGLDEEHEDIQVNVLSVADVRALYASGKISNAMCLVAVQWFLLHYEQAKEAGLKALSGS